MPLTHKIRQRQLCRIDLEGLPTPLLSGLVQTAPDANEAHEQDEECQYDDHHHNTNRDEHRLRQVGQHWWQAHGERYVADDAARHGFPPLVSGPSDIPDRRLSVKRCPPWWVPRQRLFYRETNSR